MDLDQLEVFRIIARRENISQAARDLYVSQSAVNKTLKQLENELGVQLFERSGKHLHLNHQGEVLLHYADIAGNSLSEAESLIAERRETRSNMVRMIFRVPLGNPIKALQGFMQENPKVIPHIATDSEVHGDYDLEIFSSTEDLETNDNLIKICQDRLCIIMAANHRLANKITPLSISCLKRESFIAYRRLKENTKFEEVCLKEGFSPLYSMSYEQVTGILEFISRGFIAVGPCALWLNERRDDLVARPLKEFDQRFTIYIRINKPNTARSTLSLAKHLRDHLYASFLNQQHCFE